MIGSLSIEAQGTSFNLCGFTAPSVPTLISPNTASKVLPVFFLLSFYLYVVNSLNKQDLYWNLTSWGKICGNQQTRFSNNIKI